MQTDTAPSPQAIVAWKGKGDKIVALRGDVADASAKLEAKLKPIREKFEPDIQKKKAELAKLEDEFEAFGQDHADILFAEGSEIRTKVAVIAGRETPAAVVLDETKDETEVLKAMAKSDALKKFLSVKVSFAKAAIKTMLANKGPDCKALAKQGLSLEKGFAVSVKGKGD